VPQSASSASIGHLRSTPGAENHVESIADILGDGRNQAEKHRPDQEKHQRRGETLDEAEPVAGGSAVGKLQRMGKWWESMGAKAGEIES